MKRCKAEYFFKDDSLICKGLKYLQKIILGLSEEMSTMHICIWVDISLSFGKL